MLRFASLLLLVAACGSPKDESAAGSSGSSGSSGPPGSVTAAPHGKSCTGGPGADSKCGGQASDDHAEGSVDCCDARVVPGGTFNRFNDSGFPATVSSFSLDTFLVTGGRFRAWVEATDGNLRSSAPAEGQGAHPKIPKSGWRSEWNTFLPTSRAEVDRMLGPDDGSGGSITPCQYGTDIDDLGTLTWWTAELEQAVKDRNDKASILAENTKDALDRKPLNCIPWHVLFAFCVWDGGRLPTDAEYGFAAAGGDEQRLYPWGNMTGNDVAHIDNRDDLSLVPTYQAGAKYATARLYDRTLGDNVFEDNYSFTYGGKKMAKSDNAAHVAPVGRKPLGNGKWGHADLAGGMFEWMLDEGPIRPGPCNDCANVDWPKNGAIDPNAYMGQDVFKNPGGIDWWKGGSRAIRGSAWDNANGFAIAQSRQEIEFYTSYPVGRTYRAVGGRCAR